MVLGDQTSYRHNFQKNAFLGGQISPCWSEISTLYRAYLLTPTVPEGAVTSKKSKVYNDICMVLTQFTCLGQLVEAQHAAQVGGWSPARGRIETR